MNIWRFSGQVRKTKVVILVFLLGLFGSFHLSIAQDGNDASSTLIDASSNNFPPMNVLDKDGNLTGFGCDLSDAVMKAVGRQVTHIHSPHWVQVLEWLDSGKADFIHDTGYTKDRDKFLDYSDPIIEMPEVIFVRPDQYDVTSIDSLRGKTVACVKKHISDLYLQKFPEINRHVVKTPVEGLYELIAGKVDAFIYPKQIFLYLAQTLRLRDKIKIAGDPLRILTWSMVVKEGNKKVLDLLNQGIAKVRKSGEYDRIYDKWWGKKLLAGYSKQELYVITAVTSGGSLLIALTISLLLFNRRLRKGKEGLKAEIVERKRVEEALRAALAETRRFRKALDEVSTHIYMKDPQSRYIYANRITLELFGCSAEELVGRDDTHFFPHDAVKRLREVDLRVLAGEQTFEEIDVDGAGSERRVYWEVKMPIYEESEHKTVWGLLGISTDITERKQSEEALRESEEKLARAKKMEAMGLMAGGIAHDLNNILSGIVSYPELLLMDIPEDDPMFKPIKTIQESGMRAADVVEDLMTIARGVATSKEAMNFNTVVEEYLNSTEHNKLISIRPSVTFKTRFDADLLNVNGSPTHIKKILMNLLQMPRRLLRAAGRSSYPP